MRGRGVYLVGWGGEGEGEGEGEGGCLARGTAVDLFYQWL